MNKENQYDVIVIGGGQSGLACGYYLRRQKHLSYLILDEQPDCGGAWRHVWNSLTLFSPAAHSSLPGWIMPSEGKSYPNKAEVIDYLCQYEVRYNLQVQRSIQVRVVKQSQGIFVLETNKGTYQARALISATGTWKKPYIPDIMGKNTFDGVQLHSAYYQDVNPFDSQKVLIVGEGNSGAQILSELSLVADTEWATLHSPQFLPDEVDGSILFRVATAKYTALKKGETYNPPSYSLGSIVMVPSVKDARERGVLRTKGQLKALYDQGVVWQNGQKEPFDAIIWCTGFEYATEHLRNVVDRDEKGRIATLHTRVLSLSGLWLVGYGNWTGFASATLIGVGRSARQTIKEVVDYLASQ